MGQQANNGGRRASLDDRKLRAAGRAQHSPDRDAIQDYVDMRHGKHQPVAGAFGSGDVAPLDAGAETPRATKRT